MTTEEKMEYFDIAARIVGFHFKEKDLDLLINTYDLTLEKGGETDLRSLAKIKAENEEKYKEKDKGSYVEG